MFPDLLCGVNQFWFGDTPMETQKEKSKSFNRFKEGFRTSSFAAGQLKDNFLFESMQAFSPEG